MPLGQVIVESVSGLMVVRVYFRLAFAAGFEEAPITNFFRPGAAIELLGDAPATAFTPSD